MDKATIDRMIVEFKELEEKTTKLRTFLTSDKAKEINQLNNDLLVAQLKAMEAYLCVLSVRIGLNNVPEELPTDEELTSEDKGKELAQEVSE